MRPTALPGDERLMKLFRNATEEQWVPGQTFEWNVEWDYANPLRMASLEYEISDGAFWRDIGDQGRESLSRDFQVWRLSQMLHAELAALDVCAKLTQLHTDVPAKLCCTLQAADEARHVQVFARLLDEIGSAPFPITPSLGTLIDQVGRDNRISFLSLGMQILIEGVGIGAFRRISIATDSAFVRTLFSYIMKDEARHFALGRLIVGEPERLNDEVSPAELDDFLDEALVLLDEYLRPTEVLARFGCSADHAKQLIDGSSFGKQFRRTVFGQIGRPVLELDLDRHAKTRRRLEALAGLVN
ncbi:ferritin-like domain-containing protein [Burkholderia stagnalis]